MVIKAKRDTAWKMEPKTYRRGRPELSTSYNDDVPTFAGTRETMLRKNRAFRPLQHVKHVMERRPIDWDMLQPRTRLEETRPWGARKKLQLSAKMLRGVGAGNNKQYWEH